MRMLTGVTPTVGFEGYRIVMVPWSTRQGQLNTWVGRITNGTEPVCSLRIVGGIAYISSAVRRKTSAMPFAMVTPWI